MMTRRSVLFALLALVLLAGAALVVPFALFLTRPVAPPAPAVVTIPAGTSLAQTAERLQTAGVVADAVRFRLLAMLRGASRRIQAGEYGFTAAATPDQVLDRLVAGDVRRYRWTLPEGLTLKEVAARLEAEGFGSAEEFRRLAGDPGFIGSLDLDPPSLEGYLYPETYTLVAGMPESSILQAMVRQFRENLSEEILAAARAQGLSRHQLVTLASIIQKEAGSEEEMPLISAVFHNRLQRGIPLQADPTVIYGIPDFDGNLTRRHLATRTPYNTYRNKGLPPGPIANPGLAALRAAANPAPVDFLYFVSRGDGSHQFSRTLQEHNQAVRQFQLRRRR